MVDARIKEESSEGSSPVERSDTDEWEHDTAKVPTTASNEEGHSFSSVSIILYRGAVIYSGFCHSSKWLSVRSPTLANVDERELNEEERNQRRVASTEFWRLSKMKECLLHQKSRSLWLKVRDMNSKFFNTTINRNRKHNEILGVKINGACRDELEIVKAHIREVFEEIFKEES
ncbi:hypothetical protein RIF29_10623 [Crotalaria pallida]|uniref:Uncharacterized protein n=1 Tax=Crotalaria pallida TaxID=3830 RepID=A0AAN9FSX3_CROPI